MSRRDGREIISLTERLRKTEVVALALFDILDDIDTLDDMVKNDNAAYRTAVRWSVAKRFNHAEVSDDGSKVMLRC